LPLHCHYAMEIFAAGLLNSTKNGALKGPNLSAMGTAHRENDDNTPCVSIYPTRLIPSFLPKKCAKFYRSGIVVP
ncbi:MAG: hypothetical protein ABI113_08695, partial [Mucilaginibacter sp.]